MTATATRRGARARSPTAGRRMLTTATRAAGSSLDEGVHECTSRAQCRCGRRCPVRTSTATGIGVDRDERPVPESRGRQPDDTRAAPTSSRLPRSTRARCSMHSRVVGCAPVPNARPGSTSTAGMSRGGTSHGGPIHTPPASTGRWNRRQASSHRARLSSPARPETRLERRFACLIDVCSQLEVTADVHLLEPAGHEREEPSACLLGLVDRHEERDPTHGRDGCRHGRPAHRNALFSRSKKPSSR